MIKWVQNHSNLIVAFTIGIIGIIFAFLLQYNVISPSFSAIFVLIGAGLTAILNDYYQKRAEERSELKEVLKEELKGKKLSNILCNILLLNAGLSKGNIEIIKSKEYDLHLNHLKTGFLEIAINNVSYDENVGDDDLIKIMNISTNVEALNIKIQQREVKLKELDKAEKELMEENLLINDLQYDIFKLNEKIIRNSMNLIKQIEEYANPP